MKIKNLLKDDDAVSPVIGVILMVAITVILAAVIASFVLGLGDQNNPAPTASFDFDYTDDGSGSNTGDLTITHGDGDELDGANVFLRGDSLGNTNDPSGASIGADNTWEDITGDSEIKAGKSLTIGDGSTATSSDYVARIVWEDPDSDQTSTLDTDEGPDA